MTGSIDCSRRRSDRRLALLVVALTACQRPVGGPGTPEATSQASWCDSLAPVLDRFASSGLRCLDLPGEYVLGAFGPKESPTRYTFDGCLEITTLTQNAGDLNRLYSHQALLRGAAGISLPVLTGLSWLPDARVTAESHNRALISAALLDAKWISISHLERDIIKSLANPASPECAQLAMEVCAPNVLVPEMVLTARPQVTLSAASSLNIQSAARWNAIGVEADLADADSGNVGLSYSKPLTLAVRAGPALALPAIRAICKELAKCGSWYERCCPSATDRGCHDQLVCRDSRCIEGGNTLVQEPPQKRLYEAVRDGILREVHLAVQDNARLDLPATEDHPTTILHDALAHAEVVHDLCQAGAKPNITDYYGSTPLMQAAAEGKTSAVRALLECKNVDIDQAHELYGTTALHLAAANGKADVIEILLGAGANVNAPNAEDQTPLHTAVIKRHLGAVKAFLRVAVASKLEINSLDNFNRTPSDLAAKHKARDILSALVEAGGVCQDYWGIDVRCPQP